MKIGWVGMGRLGLPVACAIQARGHDVLGFDIKPIDPYGIGIYEEGFPQRWAEHPVRMASTLAEIAEHAELIFVAVQTPHEEGFEGITPLPGQRKDFNYTHLATAIEELAAVINRPTTVAIVSTCLPGTTRWIERFGNLDLTLIYNPSFIAMGTTIQDFLDPEFVLLGADPHGSANGVETLLDFYRATILAPSTEILVMSWESAELAKVWYNVQIGWKIASANAVAQICDAIPGADCDAVMGVMKAAHRRIISPAYMTPGGGDGGGCHPRDNIALSWMAREIGLPCDIGEFIMTMREEHCRWLCEKLVALGPGPYGILGISYKKGSPLKTGSYALLCAEILQRWGHEVACYDPHALPDPKVPSEWSDCRIWLLGMDHEAFASGKLPAGSKVLDPWGSRLAWPGVEVITPGRRNRDA